MFYRLYVKRLLDILISIISLIVFFPFFIAISILIKLDSKGPLLFKQLRVGKDKKEFYILKFRTMRVETPNETPTFLLENPNNYITTIGKFLRKTSLDELPQIINILKGEMSIVGPRPVLKNERELFIARGKHGVYKIRPGLTGWAQVNGRDNLNAEEKAKFDGYYKENISLIFDAKIFILTIIKVLRSDGVREGIPQGNKKTLNH